MPETVAPTGVTMDQKNTVAVGETLALKAVVLPVSTAVVNRQLTWKSADETIATVDVYDFILNGNSSDDVKLQDGDVIIVAPYKQLVDVAGKVKRPMVYEMKDGETDKAIID